MSRSEKRPVLNAGCEQAIAIPVTKLPEAENAGFGTRAKYEICQAAVAGGQLDPERFSQCLQEAGERGRAISVNPLQG